MAETFDRRLHPVRPELAAMSYKDKFDAAKFVTGKRMQVVADVVDMRAAPSLSTGIDTQALFGECLSIYEETSDGWSWGQLETDGYVGWFRSDAVAEPASPTHRVRALRSYRYPGPDLKFPPLGLISIGSLVSVEKTVTTRGLEYAILNDGSAVVLKHLVSLEAAEQDWVSVAEEFLGTPYLWAGRSSLGLDCSALVQLSSQTVGHRLLRDSDMQEATAGHVVHNPDLKSLERGDLVFWKGHVAIALDADNIIHANGATMTVAVEPTQAALQRIAATEWGEVIAVRRLPKLPAVAEPQA
ncbi:MAG: C40 family peptidase [Rhodobacteraceae bacterium]|nr:C40 family peptidase [Paracoccaceae bacterium]